MNGDFSQWGFESGDNWNGVLHQQGRVLLDRDWNAATQIERHQRRWLARDAFGANVAAVPAVAADSFKLTQAVSDGDGVTVTYLPGNVWADGLRLNEPGSTPLALKAQYLGPPIQSPQAGAATIGAGVRDAVILDVWEESFNAFQDPLELIEPALGGPDTTERVKTAYTLRLLRLIDGDECGNLAGKLADDFSAKGKLTVTPAANVAVAGECPVEMGGGYSGFEHYLYRIEIAEPLAGQARFKWSQFNGGLVGRGVFTSTGGATGTVAISANDQAINHCGLTSFYLEALKFDTELGYWRVVLTADATLPQDGELALTNIAGTPGTWPATDPDSAFFRLWNGVDLIANFPVSLTPNELKDGIDLQFEAPAAGNSNYTPGDYWTFPARAAGVPFDPSAWPTSAPPQGVHHHRVPLGILEWDAGPVVTVTAAAGKIHDCRQVFQPLTRQKGCCYYRVGDNMKSFGDFGTIQAAIDALPPEGGEICVLPGFYPENISINGKHDIRLHGCGDESLVQAPAANPVIQLTNVQNIRIEGLHLKADDNAPGVLVDATSVSTGIELRQLTIETAKRSAIEVQAGESVSICDNRVLMKDSASPWHAVFFIGKDGLIQNNVITVQRSDLTVSVASAGRGGLHLGSTCERVRVLDNLIQYGIGNGITLGTTQQVDVNGNVTNVSVWVVNGDDPCGPCLPGNTNVPPNGGGGTTTRAGAPLYEIEIARNRILDMGLNGIGVIGFFDLSAQDEFITVVRLDIVANQIRRCLQRTLEAIPAAMIDSMGYGGIALADVEYLVIRDNLIEGNGPDHLQPICGVFVLHGEGIDISRNHILHNGAKTGQPSNTAKDGRRGGINIVYGVANTIPMTVLGKVYPRQDGVPAIKIHDNIVSQPLGQALSLAALGPVSVVGNQFTSMGMVPKVSSPTFFAACVMIWNLGESNEFYLQLGSFSGIVNGQVQPGPSGPDVTDDMVLLPQPGLDDARIGQYLANGNVLFADNQCVLDLIETGLSLAITSIAIFTLDDVAFSDNQCDCNLLDDFVLAHAFLFGFSVRMNDNRMKEGILNALYSAITIGYMNATTMNQSTHCLLVAAIIASLKTEAGNKVLLDAFFAGFCDRLGKSFVAMGGSLNMFSH